MKTALTSSALSSSTWTPFLESDKDEDENIYISREAGLQWKNRESWGELEAPHTNPNHVIQNVLAAKKNKLGKKINDR